MMGLSESRGLVEHILPGLAILDESLKRPAPEPHPSTALALGARPVLLLGAPGVGKGTQADCLAHLWKLPKISTGEILRSNVMSGTALGVEADKIMKLGALVPDRIMTEMIASRLGLPDTEIGFILDGFPRTIRQAHWLDRYLSGRGQDARLGIINLRMPPQRIIERVIHRKVCPVCKTVYNTQLLPPKRLGRCDEDGSKLIQRTDDFPEVLQRRLDAFERETEPLIRHYRSYPLFIEVDADRPPSSVTKDIVAAFVTSSLQRGQ
jgi:adenylate kinase